MGCKAGPNAIIRIKTNRRLHGDTKIRPYARRELNFLARNQVIYRISLKHRGIHIVGNYCK